MSLFYEYIQTTSTTCEIECEWCHSVYNEGCHSTNDKAGHDIQHFNFSGKTICDCCFDAVENSILDIMDGIIPWYKEVLKEQRTVLEGREAELRNI